MPLELIEVSKKLGNHQAVDNVSFTVADGEFFVLLGTSGSGKSTLMRLISGLEKPDSGKIFLDGREIASLSPRDRNLGMVFQDYGLYPNMNVHQNIAYGLEARGMRGQEVETRVVEAATKLGLAPHLKRNITDLSGGEQQRVALARALAKDASAYLYDEPLSNLDPKLRVGARKDIAEVHKLKRKPTLYVTHDQAEAFALGDRIGVLSNGRMQQIGSVETLMEAPVNTFVAGFIGSPPINLMTAQIVPQGANYAVCAEGVNVTMPAQWSSAIERYGKREIVMGIRPNAFTMQPGLAPDATAVRGEVEGVEDMLSETIVMLKTSVRGGVTAVLTDPDLDQIVEGQPLTLGIDPEAVLLFDVDTEKALSAR